MSTLVAGGFPKSVCTSVNECICHGIPDNRQLQDGDIVNIDVTVYLNVSYALQNIIIMLPWLTLCLIQLQTATRLCNMIHSPCLYVQQRHVCRYMLFVQGQCSHAASDMQHSSYGLHGRLTL